MNASIHPFEGELFVPYARIGPVYLGEPKGRLMHLNNSDARGWGIEAMVGGNFCLPNFAAGPDIRIGQTTQTWVMFGLHLEARL